MGRMVSRSRPREGKGIGEFISESIIYIIIIAAVVVAGRWYFFIYLRSPSAALLKYLGASKAGDVKTQYQMISSAAKQAVGSQDVYDDRYPMAHGLGGHIVDYTIEKMTETGEKAEADVTITVRKSGQEIYQAAADKYNDHYVLRKESDAWRIALESSQLKSVQARQR
jgi:hypothetical protein